MQCPIAVKQQEGNIPTVHLNLHSTVWIFASYCLDITCYFIPACFSTFFVVLHCLYSSLKFLILSYTCKRKL